MPALPPYVLPRAFNPAMAFNCWRTEKNTKWESEKGKIQESHFQLLHFFILTGNFPVDTEEKYFLPLKNFICCFPNTIKIDLNFQDKQWGSGRYLTTLQGHLVQWQLKPNLSTSRPHIPLLLQVTESKVFTLHCQEAFHFQQRERITGLQYMFL